MKRVTLAITLPLVWAFFWIFVFGTAIAVEKTFDDCLHPPKCPELITHWDDPDSYICWKGRRIQIGLREDGYVMWRYLEESPQE